MQRYLLLTSMIAFLLTNLANPEICLDEGQAVPIIKSEQLCVDKMPPVVKGRYHIKRDNKLEEWWPVATTKMEEVISCTQ